MYVRSSYKSNIRPHSYTAGGIKVRRCAMRLQEATGVFLVQKLGIGQFQPEQTSCWLKAKRGLGAWGSGTAYEFTVEVSLSQA